MRKNGKKFIGRQGYQNCRTIVRPGAWTEGKMKWALLAGLLVMALTAAAHAAAPAPGNQTAAVGQTEQGYTVSPGDQLEICVWKEEALTKVVTVLPDGRIVFPLVGEVVAGGKTLAQIKQEVEKRISPYIPEPTIWVEAKQVNSFLVYVIGKVNNPGRLVLNTKVNVLQALAQAGGLNVYAKRNRVKVFRYQGGKTNTFAFNYDDVIEGAHMDQNIWLEKGDVVVVP